MLHRRLTLMEEIGVRSGNGKELEEEKVKKIGRRW
jgi:hypothetical protein